ncbi:MAG: diguanylate cyclase [Syntrophobacteraceae bacterium]|nr:diguanylate cyclase [Syntrophobacteraceae bacterium]
MKILIAEDHISLRAMLETVLAKWGFEVISACNGEEALARLQEPNAPQMALLDWMMPGMDGLEVCRKIRELLPSGLPYLIILTARSDKGDIVKGLRAGADDYIAKPYDGRELLARLEVGRRMVELHQQLQAAMDNLVEQALTDPLTHSPNRRSILNTLDKEISRASREGSVFWVSMLDIDRFKTVNDRLGHLGGDAVLRECVRRVQSVLRPYDAIGRLGGEEFLIVLPTPGKACPLSAFERVRQVISDTPFEFGMTELTVTVSQGITAWTQGDCLDDLLRKADEALYRAKRNGRNRLECYELDKTACGDVC